MKWPKDRISMAAFLSISGRRVLDVGCGKGGLLNKLKDKFNELYGIEISKERVKMSREELKNVGTAQITFANIEKKTPFEDDFFDMVVLTDVIEHIVDIFAAFNEIKRIVKKGGTIITISPNIADIRRRLMLLFGKFPSTSANDEGFGFQDGTQVFDGGHLHYFTYSMLEKLYRKMEFVNIKKYGYGKFGRLHNFISSLLSPSVVIVGEK